MKRREARSSSFLNCQILGSGLIILSLLMGCAQRKPPPVGFRGVYEGRVPKLEEIDRESLKGKRIVIDPGHGGVFRGAIGRSGVNEADVNLGVALHLWGMLEEAGCDVWLTRKTDKDFVDGDANKLREDLKERVEIANKANPDLFISLHHNADPDGNPDRNEIQIYYKMEDPGPSRDIALTIARHIRLAIADISAIVKPGNYYVLRNTKAPAVLCEPSFISNPEVESKLRLSEKQRLEAEAYYAAIAEYFSRGVPKAIRLSPTGVHEDVDHIEILFETTPLIDPNSAHLEIDGCDLEGLWLSPNRIVAPIGKQLSNGIHSVSASVKSITGNSSPRVIWDFIIDRPAEKIFIDLIPKAPPPGFPQAIFVRPVDRCGRPVCESTKVVYAWDGGRFETQVKDAYAIAFRGKDIPFEVKSIQILANGVKEGIAIVDDPKSDIISGFVRDEMGNPVAGATILIGSDREVLSTGDSGFFFLEKVIPETIYVSKRGYRRLTRIIDSRSPLDISLKPFYGTLRPGSKVAIDPEETLGESSSITKEGRTASELNLEAAIYLKKLLEQYGIEVILTRNTDSHITDMDRVMSVERCGADILVSISHQQASEQTVRLEHYPSSIEVWKFSISSSTYFRKIM
ncbi:MAG: N-acetylmuramoyl-L-alanine amidase, partial [bacterium]